MKRNNRKTSIESFVELIIPFFFSFYNETQWKRNSDENYGSSTDWTKMLSQLEILGHSLRTRFFLAVTSKDKLGVSWLTDYSQPEPLKLDQTTFCTIFLCSISWNDERLPFRNTVSTKKTFYIPMGLKVGLMFVRKT